MILISVVTHCYNEEENIMDIYTAVKSILKSYNYEHIFIDNSSTDNTVNILKSIASADPNVKIIVNTRNFGHIRSPYYALLQASGDVIISIAADLQDPPELIPQFIKKWEEGYKVVVGIKNSSDESKIIYTIRTLYYYVLSKLSEVDQIKHFTGFGLYDAEVIETLRKIDDPYPYFRGLISEIGYEVATIKYTQPARKKGITKNSIYTLYDIVMLGVTNHSKVPLRLATILGFSFSVFGFFMAIIYLIYKIIYWDSFTVGIAPLVIGLFLFSSVQLFFIGIIGEYIGSIYTQTLHRPLVIEKERINF